MGKIKEDIEQRIKASANIMDVVRDGLGVVLHRSGTTWDGLCPFHADKHLGSFKVSESKNICTCFSCGKSWGPVDALMDGRGMDYPTALRWLAAKYGIYVDNEQQPIVTPAAPRQAAPDLPMIFWPISMVKPYMANRGLNPLVRYLEQLPLTKEDHKRLEFMLDMYMVGTSTQGATSGWTIWWQTDERFRVHTGKLMAYKADGHRDKSSQYSFNFVHSMLLKAGAWSDSVNRVETCLFGLHLMNMYKEAEVCIVESEKSALICSAFTDPNKRIWMATAGKANLNTAKLKPLIEAKRYIVLYPDHDGFEEWQEAAKQIGYNRLTVSNKVRDLWTESDGDKADIADIMLRQLRRTDYEQACERLHISGSNALKTFIEELHMTIDE